MHTAATAGQDGSVGSGRRALADSARTFPGVSAPSRVVRSTMRMARSSAYAFAVVLIDRVPSDAERASAPTWSTPGRPCRNRRRDTSDPVASDSSPGRGLNTAPAVMGPSIGPARRPAGPADGTGRPREAQSPHEGVIGAAGGAGRAVKADLGRVRRVVRDRGGRDHHRLRGSEGPLRARPPGGPG